MSVQKLNKENFEAVRNSDKPVLLDFYADWCGPCRMVSPLVDEIAEENPQYLVGKINVDDEPELAAEFGVFSIPTLVVMKDGKIVAIGDLAETWTATTVLDGTGKIELTGNLGDVMKESATIALEYIRCHARELGIDMRIFENYNLHIHVPEGAVPKDGPSAGITMATSITSALTQKKVRKELAMTGEITLRGKVLPVGGIREKILAAKRAGIKHIVLCHDNKKDIDEIPENYLTGLDFHYVSTVADVLDYALLKERVSNPIEFHFENTSEDQKKNN